MMAQSYKIFIKDVPLILAGADYVPLGQEYVVSESDFINDIHGAMLWFYRHHTGATILVPTLSAPDLMKQIQTSMTRMRAAGGLVRNPQNELLMIFRKGKWDLPKGKIDKGEEVTAAAKREVAEETGLLNTEVQHPITTSWHIYPEKSEMILKETHWFAMTCPEPSLLTPQNDEGITEAVWVKPEDIHHKLKNTYGNIRELLSKTT